MSGMEIERKFLLKRGSNFRALARKVYDIKQGYILAVGAIVRIRVRDDEAFLTIKSPTKNSISRYEFEKPITRSEAEELLKLCVKPMIEKKRYLVDVGSHTFEIDEFHGENEGLVVAEVELGSEDEAYERPGFILKEITGDSRFTNMSLVHKPIFKWREEYERMIDG